jgi:hypothetical protein
MHLNVQPGADILETHMALSISPSGKWLHQNADFLVWVPMQCHAVWAPMQHQAAMQRLLWYPMLVWVPMPVCVPMPVWVPMPVVWVPMQRPAMPVVAHLDAISPMLSARLASLWLC